MGSTPEGRPWIYGTGAVFGISGEQAYIVSATGATYAAVDVGVSDCVVSTYITTLGGEPGLYGRVIDDNNWWRAVLSGGDLYLQKLVAGVKTTVVNPPVTFSAGDYLSIAFYGGVIQTRINGIVVSIVQDSDNISGTKHGLGFGIVNSTARFDSFRVSR